MVEVKSVETVRGRVRITLENGARYELRKNLFRERPVEPGEEVEEENFAKWVTLHQYRPALDQAVAMLANRACSRGEVERRLRNSGYSADTVEMVLYKLEKHELLNDQEFAEQWVRYRTGLKYGPRRIAAELRQKGVSAEETEEALAPLREEEQTELAVLLARKGLARRKPEEDLRKTFQRTIGSIVRRGFDWDTAREACERAAREMELEAEE